MIFVNVLGVESVAGIGGLGLGGSVSGVFVSSFFVVFINVSGVDEVEGFERLGLGVSVSGVTGWLSV